MSTIKFIHVRNGTHFGGMTVAYAVHDDQLHYNIAICSDKDHYCKAIGRNIAAGRLTTSFAVAIPLPKDANYATAVLNHINEGV